MLSFALRRGAFISHKVLYSLCSSQRCRSTALPHLFTSNPSPCLPSLSANPFLLARPLHSSVARPKKRPQPEPPPREPGLLRYDMEELHKSPKPAVYLSVASLLPFVCPTLYMAMTETYIPEVAYAQVAYGASFLSFMGGARWGFALPPSSPAKLDWENLANSVVPSLLACVTMLLIKEMSPAILMLIIGLGIALHYDLALLPTYPPWFKALRAIMTVVAAASLTGLLMVYGIYPEKKLFSEGKDK